MGSKHLLLVTYYWPPAGGPGVQRWLKFTRYLCEMGYRITLVIPENPSYPLTDETLLKEVPSGLDIHRLPIWEPYTIAEKFSRSNKKFKAGQFDKTQNQSILSRISIWIRGNFFIPDARRFWIQPTVKYIQKTIFTSQQLPVLITTGPPHSVHLIGLQLKTSNPTLQWVADFRDPWTEISYFSELKLTNLARKIHYQMESAVLKHSDLVLATSYSDAENFRTKGANAYCITNGYDPEDLPEASSEEKDRAHFTIAYIGVLEQLRNPVILWDVLEEIYQEIAEFRSVFRFVFVGKVDPKIILNLQNRNFSSNIDYKGYIPHRKALEEMNRADTLLLTNFPDTKHKGIIPGKLFEYLASAVPIMSFGPNNADVSRILSYTSGGAHFGYMDTSALKEHIRELFNQWQNQVPRRSTEKVYEFSRKNLTLALTSLLEQELN